MPPDLSPVTTAPSYLIVGADAHIGPLGSFEFAADFCINGAFCRGDVGIAPYNRTGINHIF